MEGRAYAFERRKDGDRHPAGLLAAGWGVLGAAALLGRAAWALGAAGLRSAEAFDGPQWALVTGWVAAMCLFQGYLGLQRSFVPRVLSRAVELAGRPVGALEAVLSPLFCIGLIGGTEPRQRASWALVLTMGALVLAVSRLPEPYRGLVDLGVAAGLAWGLVALAVQVVRAASGQASEAR